MSGSLLPGRLPLSVGGPSKNVLENFTFKDDVSWVKNKHSFKFAADLLHQRRDQWSPVHPAESLVSTARRPDRQRNDDNSEHRRYQPGFVYAAGSVTSFSSTIPTAAWLPRENSSIYFQIIRRSGRI